MEIVPLDKPKKKRANFADVIEAEIDPISSSKSGGPHHVPRESMPVPQITQPLSIGRMDFTENHDDKRMTIIPLKKKMTLLVPGEKMSRKKTKKFSRRQSMISML